MKTYSAKDYVGNPVDCRQGRAFESWNRGGWDCIPVLEFLRGKPWNDYALGMCHALRPSRIRVVPHHEGIQLDAEEWRVTVWLRKDGTIREIDQEVQVGLPDDCRHGADLWEKIEGRV